MTLIAPLDLEQIFVVNVSGTPEIFSFVAILLISFALAKFDFPNKISLAFFALFGIVMATYLQGIYVLIILLGGITTFYALSKMLK